ncbi:MAG: protein kinase [Pyrinomonadaceae bacterium]|nr:protein kinase [Pyrinomonadaceae bacterium]
MFKVGQQIGIYTLLRKLGQGGFGEVWLAEKTSESFRTFSKKVALKLPHSEQVDFSSIEKEANLWEQASGHPNVLPIIDADVIDGQIVIVSEFADGGSLADKLSAVGKIPTEKAVEYMRGILSGLQFLHSKGIIHRDIKPQNILLQGDIPRLADFGISRMMNTNTLSATIVGTDAYMSPEALDGERSVQTDIWSVGVVLYQMIQGRLPFSQTHRSERMFAILTKEFTPLSAEVPQRLKEIIARTLAKNPAQRFESAAAMNSELQKFNTELSRLTNFPTEVILNFEIKPEKPAVDVSLPAADSPLLLKENAQIVTEKLQTAEPVRFAPAQFDSVAVSDSSLSFAPTVDTVISSDRKVNTPPPIDAVQPPPAKTFPISRHFIFGGAIVLLLMFSGILLGARWLMNPQQKPAATESGISDGSESKIENSIEKNSVTVEPGQNETQNNPSTVTPANSAAQPVTDENPTKQTTAAERESQKAKPVYNKSGEPVEPPAPKVQNEKPPPRNKRRTTATGTKKPDTKLGKDRLFDPDAPN